MYTFISAVLRKKGYNKRFETVNLSNVKMSALFNDYRDGYIELSNPSLTNRIYVKLTDLKAAKNLIYVDVVFPTWLALQLNNTIFGSIIKPKLTTGSISYSDAFQAGCIVRRVNPSDIPGKNTYTLDMMPDVYLTKNIADYTLIQKYVLTTVNGLCHVNIPAAKGILIKGAGLSLDEEQDNLLGVLSFEKIAPIQQLSIKDTMIRPSPEGKSLKQAIYLDLNKNLTGKSLMISFMGRLFVADGVIEKINNKGACRINTYRIDILRLILQSIGKINLTKLDLDERKYKAKTLKIEDILDDDVVLEILKLPQTFIVIVDKPSLFVEKTALQYTSMPGFYETEKNNRLPYIDDHGILSPYWKISHKATYTTIHRLHLKDTFYRDPMYHTSGYLTPAAWINDNYVYHPRTQYHVGHLLDLYSQEMIYN